MLLIGEGAHPKAIQAHLGHSTIAVTFDRYGHLFPDDMDRLARGLDRVRGQALVGVSRDSRGTGVAQLRSAQA